MTKSKTIQGIIITLTCVLIATVANIAGIDHDAAATQEVITSNIANISTSIGALYGLYRAWKGRMNPKIEPLKIDHDKRRF